MKDKKISIRRKRSISRKSIAKFIEEQKKVSIAKCWDKFIFSPNKGYKVYWDLFIIILALYNAIYVPLEFSFTDLIDNEVPFTATDYLVDAIFFIDIIFSFRTSYIDSKTEEVIRDSKKMAFHYIFRGRFFIDLAASIPAGEIYVAIDENRSTSSLKFLAMLKLIRLLRLGRMITYLRMNQTFKFGMRIV